MVKKQATNNDILEAIKTLVEGIQLLAKREDDRVFNTTSKKISQEIVGNLNLTETTKKGQVEVKGIVIARANYQKGVHPEGHPHVILVNLSDEEMAKINKLNGK